MRALYDVSFMMIEDRVAVETEHGWWVLDQEPSKSMKMKMSANASGVGVLAEVVSVRPGSYLKSGYALACLREYDFFKLACSAKGVGPTKVMAVLAAMTIEEIYDQDGAQGAMAKIKGVGPKIAGKIADAAHISKTTKRMTPEESIVENLGAR